LREIHPLATWVIESRIRTAQELEARGDASMLDRWRKLMVHYGWAPDHGVRVLKVWGRAPHASAMFPMLEEVSFRDEASFGEMAAKYLRDESLRQGIAKDMRRIVLEHFSYASRWKDFMGHVARELSCPEAVEV
jgi:hypothetical protein